MKKLLVLASLSLFAFLPSNAKAMVEYDENGQIIEKEIKEGEVSIMADPDVSISSEGEIYTMTDPDMTISSEEDLYFVTGNEEDGEYKTTNQEKDDVFTTTSAPKENNSLPYLLIGGSVLIVGGYFIFIKRKEASLLAKES